MNISQYSKAEKKSSPIIAIVLVLISVLGYGYVVFAAAPLGGYTPGATLDPDCAPGATDCIVALPSGGSGWSLTGNAGTTAGTNFIGTTDAQDLVFKTNNTQTARIFNSSGSLLVGSGTSLLYGGSAGSEENKMFFDPTGQSFRVGSVIGTEWDGSNAGVRSVAIGFAFPAGSIPGPKAQGIESVAIGPNARALGDFSTAIGLYSVASGDSSYALGPNNATGYQSTALGHGSTASGTNSFTLGNTTNASGVYSSAFGLTTSAKSYGEFATGTTNTDYTPISATTFQARDRLFVIGNGNLISTLPYKSDALTVLKNGDVAIGVNNWEADSDATTIRFKVASGSSTVARFVDTTTGTSCDVIPSAGGSVLCSSDETLKQNIQTLDVSNALTSIEQLKPVTYNWKKGSTQTVTGFIAQDVKTIFPDLVIQNSDGKLAVSYSGLVPYTVAAIQQLDLNFSQIQNIADTSKPSNLRTLLVSWLGNVSNGITDLFAGTVHATNQLCVGTTCVTQAQFMQMVQSSGAVTSSPAPVVAPADPSTASPTVVPTTPTMQDSTSPVVTPTPDPSSQSSTPPMVSTDTTSTTPVVQPDITSSDSTTPAAVAQ